MEGGGSEDDPGEGFRKVGSRGFPEAPVARHRDCSISGLSPPCSVLSRRTFSCSLRLREAQSPGFRPSSHTWVEVFSPLECFSRIHFLGPAVSDSGRLTWWMGVALFKDSPCPFHVFRAAVDLVLLRMKHRAISRLAWLSPLCFNFSIVLKLKFLLTAYEAKHLSPRLYSIYFAHCTPASMAVLLVKHTNLVLTSGLLHLLLCLESSSQSCLLI